LPWQNGGSESFCCGLFARFASVLRGSAILTSSRDFALLLHVIYPRKQKTEVVVVCHLHRQNPDQQLQPAPRTRDCLCAALPEPKITQEKTAMLRRKLKALQLCANYLELCTEVQLRFTGAADGISWPRSHRRRVEADDERKKQQRKRARHARRRARFRIREFEC
jgi:hypothetical protein